MDRPQSRNDPLPGSRPPPSSIPGAMGLAGLNYTPKQSPSPRNQSTSHHVHTTIHPTTTKSFWFPFAWHWFRRFCSISTVDDDSPSNTERFRVPPCFGPDLFCDVLQSMDVYLPHRCIVHIWYNALSFLDKIARYEPFLCVLACPLLSLSDGTTTTPEPQLHTTLTATDDHGYGHSRLPSPTAAFASH